MLFRSLPFVGMNPPGVQTPLGILVLPFVGMNQPSVQMPLGIMLPSNVKVLMGITIPPNAGITTGVAQFSVCVTSSHKRCHCVTLLIS